MQINSKVTVIKSPYADIPTGATGVIGSVPDETHRYYQICFENVLTYFNQRRTMVLGFKEDEIKLLDKPPQI